MKRYIILLVATIFLMTSAVAFAEYERRGIGGGGDKSYKKHYKTEYAKPVSVKAIRFKARLKNGKVYTSWKRYTREDFKYYKVVKSQTSRDPVYPMPYSTPAMQPRPVIKTTKSSPVLGITDSA